MEKLCAPPGGVNRRTALASMTAAAMATATSGAAWAQEAGSKPDAARFFRLKETLSADLSPDGKQVALRTRAKHGGVMLSVITLATMEPKVLHSQESADACAVTWVNDRSLLFSIEDLAAPEGKRDAGPGLFSINADGTDFRQLVERQDLAEGLRLVLEGGIATVAPTGASAMGGGPAPAGQDGMGFKQVKDAPNVKNLLAVGADRLLTWDTYLLPSTNPAGGDQVVMWRRQQGSDNSFIELLQVNTQTGRTKSLDLPRAVLSAHLGANGEVQALVVRGGGARSVLWRDSPTVDWRTLPQCVPEDDADWAIEHIDSAGKLYISARRGRDMLALWTFDVAKREWSAKPLAESPAFDVNASILVAQAKVAGVRFAVDAEVTRWLDTELQEIQTRIDQMLPRTVNRLTVPTRGNSPWIQVDAFSDTQPEVYLLYHRETRKLSRIGSQRPDIATKDQTSMARQLATARDAKKIPVWVVRPKSLATVPAPTVVWLNDALYAHSGQWMWREEMQFLSARGFAVINPEPRGTRGLGADYARAGMGQVATGMADDIVDAVQWAIQQGIADPKRIAFVGSGFGACSGLAAMARQPQLFRGGAVWAGVTDPVIRNAAALKQPLLVAHGQKDTVAPFGLAEDFRKAVQANNAGAEWLSYKDEGHTLTNPANRIDFWNRTARFLDRNLAANL